jgi:hypothetical protein
VQRGWEAAKNGDNTSGVRFLCQACSAEQQRLLPSQIRVEWLLLESTKLCSALRAARKRFAHEQQ